MTQRKKLICYVAFSPAQIKLNVIKILMFSSYSFQTLIYSMMEIKKKLMLLTQGFEIRVKEVSNKKVNKEGTWILNGNLIDKTLNVTFNP